LQHHEYAAFHEPERHLSRGRLRPDYQHRSQQRTVDAVWVALTVLKDTKDTKDTKALTHDDDKENTLVGRSGGRRAHAVCRGSRKRSRKDFREVQMESDRHLS